MCCPRSRCRHHPKHIQTDTLAAIAVTGMAVVMAVVMAAAARNVAATGAANVAVATVAVTVTAIAIVIVIVTDQNILSTNSRRPLTPNCLSLFKLIQADISVPDRRLVLEVFQFERAVTSSIAATQ